MPEFTVEQLNARIKADPEMTQLYKDDPTEFESKASAIYHRFGYNPDGSPMSTAGKAFGKISRATGIPEAVVQGVANVPIPLATTAAGAAIGTVAGVPGPGTAIGASAGSVVGEYANYALGLRDKPGPVDVSVAAAAPLVGPLASRAKSGVSNVIQSLPGAGKTMHALAGETLRKQVKHMEVTADEVKFMRGLFDAVPDFRSDVPMFRDAVKQELDLVSRSLTPDKGYIAQLNALTKQLSSGKHFSFKQLMSTENDLNKLKEAAPHDVWKRLSGILISDLENQSTNPKLSQATRGKILQGVESYKNFVAVNNRFQGQEALNTLVNSSVKQVDDDLVRFDKKAFLKQIRTGKNLKVFEKTELDDIEKAVKDLGFIGMAPKGATSNVVHTGGLGAAGLAAYAVGGVSGVVAITAILGTMRFALGSEMGRRAITHLAKKGHGTIQAAELKEIMGQITAGASAGGVAGVSGASTRTEGSVKPFANME